MFLISIKCYFFSNIFINYSLDDYFIPSSVYLSKLFIINIDGNYSL